MITKAIVEELVSPYQVKVRIPTLDSSASSPVSTSSDNLNIATICSLPNCYINLQVGDVVFVGFEDNTYYKAVVLGHLCREASTDTYADITFGNVSVRGSSTLSSDTTIGEVTSDEIKQLSGATENIQKKLNDLQEQINILFDKIQGGVS